MEHWKQSCYDANFVITAPGTTSDDNVAIMTTLVSSKLQICHEGVSPENIHRRDCSWSWKGYDTHHEFTIHICVILHYFYQ